MKIYFDMDGVLADFDGMLRKHHPHVEDFSVLPDDEFWPLVKAIPNFWEDLEILPGANEMVKAAFENENVTHVEVLSAPSRHDLRSYAGKVKWLEKHFSEYFPFDLRLNLVIAKNKKHFAEPGSVLIDDLDKNIDAWNKNGGFGILHKDTEFEETLKFFN